MSALVRNPAQATLARVDQRWHGPLKLLAAAFTLFLIGFLVAVYLLFPPPPAPRDGIVVPNLIGQSSSSAADRLRPLGLDLGDTLVIPSANVAPGIVVAQSPLPGQQLRSGDYVRLGLSAGLPAAVVPDVIGLGAKRAENLLARLGFGVDQTFEPSYRPNGTVIRTAPEAGDRLPLPARVMMVVSGGMLADSVVVDTLVRADTVRLLGDTSGASGGAVSAVAGGAASGGAVAGGAASGASGRGVWGGWSEGRVHSTSCSSYDLT